jgi:hypothetical protein
MKSFLSLLREWIVHPDTTRKFGWGEFLIGFILAMIAFPLMLLHVSLILE